MAALLFVIEDQNIFRMLFIFIAGALNSILVVMEKGDKEPMSTSLNFNDCC